MVEADRTGNLGIRFEQDMLEDLMMKADVSGQKRKRDEPQEERVVAVSYLNDLLDAQGVGV